ncbi:putative reverse transcriptase domain protein [Escherichia coli MP021561.3]|nr:putative reverse transcriptase domain protein [Escherichia coli MP021561.3]
MAHTEGKWEGICSLNCVVTGHSHYGEYISQNQTAKRDRWAYPQ